MRREDDFGTLPCNPGGHDAADRAKHAFAMEAMRLARVQYRRPRRAGLSARRDLPHQTCQGSHGDHARRGRPMNQSKTPDDSRRRV